MAFKSKPIAVGTGDTDIYVVGATLQAALLLTIGNNAGGALTWTLKYYKASTAATTTLVTSKSLAANDVFKFPMPLLMETGDKVIMSASAAGILAHCSVADSAAAPVAAGWNPRGTYSAISTYALNDVVDHTNGNSYISRVDGNVGNDPSTSPTQWMINALRGTTGAGDFTGPGASTANNLMSFNDNTGKVGKDSGYKVGTSGANTLGLLNGNNTIAGANAYDKTQTANEGTLVTATAADFSSKQRWKATVNGGLFTIANPTGGVDKTEYRLAIDFTTSHGVAFGNKIKFGDYTASAAAGKKDRLTLEYDSTADLYYLTGYRKDVGA